MENQVKVKRGFLNGWDALVILGTLVLGSSIAKKYLMKKLTEDYLTKKLNIAEKEKDLAIEREKTHQKEIDLKKNENNKKK